MELGPSGRPVMRAVEALSSHLTNNCARPDSAVETNARRFPSGDQRGLLCAPAPAANGLSEPLAASTSQIDGAMRSVMMSADRRT